MVEKDYWLMHCLCGLQQHELRFDLKGGTSLSKGFGMIGRFSEDVDIRIEPPAALTVSYGKNQDKPAHRDSRDAFFDWLVAKLAIPGVISVERDREFDDSKLRNAGIRLAYESVTGSSPDLKPFILLEVGFDVTTPNEPRDISSWAYEAVLRAGIEVLDNRAIQVPCYLPEYTLVEKIQAISTRFRRVNENEILPVNFIRHYYDVFELLGQERVQKFIGSEKYHAHKLSRFKLQDEKDLTKNEAFTISDLKVRERYRKEYEKMLALIYSEAPTFDMILERIAQYRTKL